MDTLNGVMATAAGVRARNDLLPPASLRAFVSHQYNAETSPTPTQVTSDQDVTRGSEEPILRLRFPANLTL